MYLTIVRKIRSEFGRLETEDWRRKLKMNNEHAVINRITSKLQGQENSPC
jgi:hypothetical protein